MRAMPAKEPLVASTRPGAQPAPWPAGKSKARFEFASADLERRTPLRRDLSWLRTADAGSAFGAPVEEAIDPSEVLVSDGLGRAGARSSGLLRHSGWDALLVALAALHGVALLTVPCIALIA